MNRQTNKHHRDFPHPSKKEKEQPKTNLKGLHGELIAELAIVKSAHNELGIMITDMRGQIDTIFEREGVKVPKKQYDYVGFKTTRKD